MTQESPTEQARAYFYRNYQYTREHLERDYRAELLSYRDDTWDAPQRAARLSAAVKRYKTYQMLCFIFETARYTDLDFTPLVVRRLCAGFFGRQGSQDIIVDIFGQKGRLHRSRDSSPDLIEKVVSRYRHQATTYWNETLRVIERVKLEYRHQVRAARSRQDG